MTWLRNPTTFLQKTLVIVGIAFAAVAALFLFWQLRSAFVLLFAAIILGVLLDGASNWLSEETALSRGWALALILLILLLIVVLLAAFAVPRLAQQFQALQDSLGEAVDQLQQQLEQWPLLAGFADSLQNPQSLMSGRTGTFGRITGMLSRALDFVVDVIIIIAVGIYLAVHSSMYRNGFIKLIPPSRRDHIRKMLARMGVTLRYWFVGRLASMIIVGIMSVAGLMLLGVPLALILGIITGLFALVPIIGPTLALAAPMLVASTQSLQLALWVFVLYQGIQFVESYFLTPMIQKRVIEVPPALLIMSQVVLGILTGIWGVLIAPPLAAITIVAVKTLYVEDVLEDHLVHYNADEHSDELEKETGRPATTN